MADPTPTPAAPAPSSTVRTLTLVAQVMGWLITTFGGILTLYAQSHSTSLWPGVAVSGMGILLNIATHYGYAKGQAVTSSAGVNAAMLAAGPVLAQFLQAELAKYLTPAAPVAPAALAVSATGPAPGTTVLKPAVVAGGAATPAVPK